jgi:hypothetical protein
LNFFEIFELKRQKIIQKFQKSSRSFRGNFSYSVRHTMPAQRHLKFSNLVLYLKSY